MESAYHWEEIDMSCRRLAFVVVSATLILGSLSLTGCVTSKAVLTSSYSSTNHYGKVYMMAMDTTHDPRGVQPKVADKLRAMGLEVEMVDPEKVKDRQGTGFMVSERGHILTCAHAVGDEKEATIWVGGERVYADVVLIDTNADIALLKPQTELTNQLRRLWIVPDAKPAMGQDVYTIGFPLSDILGKSARFTKGLVSATVGEQDDPKHLQVSAEVQPGNSGSPLLDENGKVIGMIDSSLNAAGVFASTGGALPQNVNFAVKAEVLVDFLKQAGLPAGPTGDVATAKQPFDQVKDSVVLVRSGKVLPGDEERSELWCRIHYVYFWDLYWRFRYFSLDFYDVKSRKLVLHAAQNGDNLNPEDATIKSTCKKIRTQLFPGLAPPE